MYDWIIGGLAIAPVLMYLYMIVGRGAKASNDSGRQEFRADHKPTQKPD